MQLVKIIIISVENMICMFVGSVITTNLANSQETPISFWNVVCLPSVWLTFFVVVALNAFLVFLETKQGKWQKKQQDEENRKIARGADNGNVNINRNIEEVANVATDILQAMMKTDDVRLARKRFKILKAVYNLLKQIRGG